MARILFACTQLHSHGGIQRFNRNLVQAWTELGADIDIVSVNDVAGGFDTYRNLKGIRCYYAARSKWKWFRTIFKLMVDRSYDMYVCGHINLAPAFALALLITKRSFSNSRLILHGIESWGRVTGPRRMAAARFERVLGVSQYTVRNFLEQMGTFSETHTAIFPNTINPDLAQHLPDLSRRTVNGKRLHILSVTRLDKNDRDKGLPDIIAALGKLRKQVDFTYTIVGDGNDRSFLSELAIRAGIADQTDFRGALSDDALWKAYEEADVFVLPSKKEGFGIVFLEAMYFGLPVLGAAEKGVLDVIEHGVNGFLVNYGDVDQIERFMIELANNPGMREKMAKAGRSMVTTNGRFGYLAFRERTGHYLLGCRNSPSPNVR